MSTAKVTFDLRRGVITVEGSGDDLGKLFDAARSVAPSFKEIRVVASYSGPERIAPAEPSGQEERQQLRHERAPSMRDFARRVATDNTSERIALLAYHAREHGGRADAAAGGGAGDLGDDKIGLTGERVGLLQSRAAAVGEAVAAAGAGLLGDAIGVGARDDRADIGVGSRLATPALGQGACIAGAARAVGAEPGEAMGEIGVVAAEAAFGE